MIPLIQANDQKFELTLAHFNLAISEHSFS